MGRTIHAQKDVAPVAHVVVYYFTLTDQLDGVTGWVEVHKAQGGMIWALGGCKSEVDITNRKNEGQIQRLFGEVGYIGDAPCFHMQVFMQQRQEGGQ